MISVTVEPPTLAHQNRAIAIGPMNDMCYPLGSQTVAPRTPKHPIQKNISAAEPYDNRKKMVFNSGVCPSSR